VKLQAHFAEQDDGRREQRGSERRALRLDIPGEAHAAGEIAVTIRDLSLTGMLIETSAPLVDGESFQIELPEAGNIEAIVVWNSGELFGCQFKWPISPAALSGALLKGEAQPREDSAQPDPADMLAELQRITAHVQKITAMVERSVKRLKGERKGKPDR